MKSQYLEPTNRSKKVISVKYKNPFIVGSHFNVVVIIQGTVSQEQDGLF